MRLAGSLAKAQAIAPGQHAKARDLHYDLEQELEHGLYDEDEADEGERALAHLEAHHPGVREASRAVTRPPNLSRPAKRHLDESSSEPELEPEREPEREREREPRRQRATGTGSSRSRSRSSHAGRVVARAFGVSGSDVSGAVIRGLQFLLAAGLAYQVLQPKGAGAFDTVLSGIGRGVSLIVDPVDPLKSSSSRDAQGYAQAQAAIAAASAAAPAGGMFDTPTGPAPFRPPTHIAPQGGFDTPGGFAPYRPPPGIPRTRVPLMLLPHRFPTNTFDTPKGRAPFRPPPGIKVVG